MTTPLVGTRQNYQPAFLAFLADPDQATCTLRTRLAVRPLSTMSALLDLIRRHHRILAEVLLDPASIRVTFWRSSTRLPGFLVESLARSRWVAAASWKHQQPKNFDGPGR